MASWSVVPSGSAQYFVGIWGAAANDIWAVGGGGTILHYNGTAWSPVASGTVEDLDAVYGFASNDVWAVGGNGTILHWDGVSWSLVASPTANYLDAIFGVAPNDIWAATPFGNIIHWDGISWSTVVSGTAQTLYAIWGAASNDIWFSSFSGDFFHWDGLTISLVNVATTEYWVAMLGFGANDIWAAGGGEDGNFATQFWHYNGAWAFDSAGVPPNPNEIDCLWGPATNDLWAGNFDGSLYHYDGVAWTGQPTPTAEQLLGAWGFATNDVWMVGTNGLIIHYADAVPPTPGFSGTPVITLPGARTARVTGIALPAGNNGTIGVAGSGADVELPAAFLAELDSAAVAAGLTLADMIVVTITQGSDAGPASPVNVDKTASPFIADLTNATASDSGTLDIYLAYPHTLDR